MRIDVYLDDADEPLASFSPPERFELDSTCVDDGAHRLRFRAFDEQGSQGERVVTIQVRNGPAIAVHGVVDGDQVSGTVPILVNAYGAQVGDDFEPMRIETPAPVPTWAWVLCLAVLGWAVGYVALETTNHASLPQAASTQVGANAVPAGTAEAAGASTALGEAVYGSRCANCHGASGDGVPGVFPPLKGNPAVLAEDPAEHIKAILDGVAGKVIEGIAYPAPMPAFGSLLNDEEVAAVVNHERTQWGNRAPEVSAADVAALR